MKHNSVTQSDTTLKFDGAESETTGRVNQKMHTNHWSGHANDGRLVQKPQSVNRRDNDGSCSLPANLGASVTRDKARKTMTSNLPSVPAQGSVRDSINRGSQYRGEGGVVVKCPTNPDRIRMGQSGGGSFNREGPGKTPATRGGETNFNFGVKKQY